MLQQIEVVDTGLEHAVDGGMLESVRALALSTGPLASRLEQLQLKYCHRDFSSSLVAPFPSAYYETLLTSIEELTTAGLAPEALAASWESLIRLVLYMNLKRIPISKYGACLLANSGLRQQLEALPVGRFGPVGCRTANFYCFLSLGSAVGQMRDLLAGQLASLDQHFKALGAEVGMGEEKFMLALDSDQQGVQNYFLEACPSEQQWARFQAGLRARGSSVFYQVIVIAEPSQSDYSVGQRAYPCSLETIANAYLEAYLPCRKERLLKDKVVQLRRVSQQLHALAATVLPPCRRISCALHSRAEEPLIESAVRPILAEEAAEEKAYYLLMARMDKHRLDCPQWQLDPALAALLTLAHPKLP